VSIIALELRKIKVSNTINRSLNITVHSNMYPVFFTVNKSYLNNKKWSIDMPKDFSVNPNNTCVGKQVLEPPHHEPDTQLSALGSSGVSKISSSNCMIVTAVSSVRLGLEYPFWSVRVNMQSNSTINSSITKTVKNIYQANGFKGFYPGAGPYFLSLLCKQTYRLPAISLLPDYFKSWVPDSWESHYGLPHVIAVSSLAVSETMIFGPLERVVRYKMVNNEVSKLNLRFLYTGTGVGLVQNLLTWNLFAGLESFGQIQARKLLKKDTLDTRDTFGVGLFVGISMTVLTQPIDALQTFAQTRSVEDKRPLLMAYKGHIQRHGILTSFSGVRAGIAQGSVGAIATVFALEALRDQNKPLIEYIDSARSITSESSAPERSRPSV
jgi:hypothetical protein